MPKGGPRARAGRRPKPTALKLLQGNPGRRPIDDSREPKPDLALPQCPDELHGAGLREWNRIVPELYKVGLLTKIDQGMLLGYCLARHRLAEAVAEDDFRKERAALEIMHRYMVEFGMSPSSRSRVKIDPKDDKEVPDDEAFLARRGLKVVS